MCSVRFSLLYAHGIWAMIATICPHAKQFTARMFDGSLRMIELVASDLRKTSPPRPERIVEVMERRPSSEALLQTDALADKKINSAAAV